MAEALLQWTIGDQTTAVEIDVTPTRGYERTAEVTEHPVEDGSPIGDHIKLSNGVVTLEGIISNTPIRVPTGQAQGATRAPATITLPNAGAATVMKWSGPFDRVRECDALFDALVTAKARVTLTTGLRFVENLILTRYKVDESRETTGSLAVTMELKQLRIATTQRAPVPAVRRLVTPASAGTRPVDDRSVLARGLDRNAAVTDAQNRARLRRQQQNGAV